jgi:hypothetical protein
VLRGRDKRGINKERRGGEGQREKKEEVLSGGCLEASLQGKGCKLEVGAGQMCIYTAHHPCSVLQYDIRTRSRKLPHSVANYEVYI